MSASRGLAVPSGRQTADTAWVAVFAALIVALGAVYFPLPFSPVPITGQTLGVLLAANILGARRGTASVALVLLIGAAGMPVFAGGRGGVGVLVGASGGYFIGWILTTAILGALLARLPRSRAGFASRMILNVTLGVLLTHLAGVPWLAFVADRPLREAIAVGMVPFLPGDVLKAVVAAIAADRALAALPRSSTARLSVGAASSE